MTPNKIEHGTPPSLSNPAAEPPSPPPEDVESFRAVLTGVACKVEDTEIEHLHDHEQAPEHRSSKNEHRNAEEERERASVQHSGNPPTTAIARQPSPPPTPQRSPADQETGNGARKRRGRFGPHRERQDAMEPLAQLIMALRARQSESITRLNIVPPAPNPLRLTLQITGDEHSFVVKARTSLPQDRRDEVRQALNVLERMLTQRLPESMRVTVTLLA